MKCDALAYLTSGKPVRCQELPIGEHGLCALHLERRILEVNQDIAEDEHDMRIYLDDARAHRQYEHHRSHVIARVKEVRQFNHRVIRLRRELRELEASS